MHADNPNAYNFWSVIIATPDKYCTPQADNPNAYTTAYRFIEWKK
jgi:hypothetical protein